MKKLSIVSVSFIAVSIAVSLFSCKAQTPKANLKTEIDSLSYAFGVANTQGIDQYLLSQGIDSTFIEDFIEGFIEGASTSKEDKKTGARMLGLQIGTNLNSNMENISRNLLGDDSTEVLSKPNLLAGFIDGVLNKTYLIPREESRIYLNTVSERIKSESMEKKYEQEKEENLKYLEDNKSKEGVVVLPSGLQYKVLKEGRGAKPAATDTVKVNYVGTTIDGNQFDSSVEKGKPAEFALDQVIKGWTEGIQLMTVGSKYVFYIPYDLAYGAEGRPGSIPPFATLIFDVDLLDINPSK
ncbi:MAG: FKBP-type peptidyl-prolyl cis-trans isomerase [Dysgonamonadaceae bacterium]|jgi:FKBP-type peptidyl-prolyl cis-trans isomerase FklB|nr:FKBP-type peptidyl-prolyl cis-trans isomerase [Dysgonamonadaceae bacterium]